MTSTLPAILVALLLPWLLGCQLARWLMGATHPLSSCLGYGYLLGLLLVTWTIKACDALALPLQFWSITAVLLLTTGVAYGALYRYGGSTYSAAGLQPARPPKHLPSLWKIGIVGMLSLATVGHFVGVTHELLLRPTFPWDAWSSWQPEAIQYFDHRSLYAPVDTNRNYGELTTLTLLWMMLASGETHQPLLHLPWLCIYGALGLVVHGHLQERCGALGAAVGGYLVLSLPYLNIHTALAGYADIWIAVIFTAGILSLHRYLQTRRIGELALFLLMIIVCAQSKRAGAGFAIALLGVAAITWMLHAKRIVALLIGSLGALGLAVLVLVITGNLDLEIPLSPSRTLTFSASELRVTDLFFFHLSAEWHPESFVQAIFQYSSWHLTTWYWCATALLMVALRRWQAMASPESLGILLGLGVTLLFFYLEPRSALDQTRLSRVLLYLLPLAIVMFISQASWVASRATIPAMRQGLERQ
ncbi:MAG: hypothetical protein NXH81_06840 [Halieaceae bacterium]|uniref:hypothetical protein n=1 Tax=Haliea alexandrii TaxID=2448162 RepID=UPI000F0B888A|nr:hypothetical protein [Haliea alexandrii]MCR9185093.1 hypothetical protein [Halieaceae bacterium]